MGSPQALGGMPVRERNRKAKCECRGTTTFETDCPPVGGDTVYTDTDCAWKYDGEGNLEYGLDHNRVQFPDTGSTEADQFPLSGRFMVSSECTGCSAGDGAAAGEPYPFIPLNPDGSYQRLDGWDSRAPLFWVLEHPDACFLVPEAETVHISEAVFLATERYSDICDYVMQ
eukprot:4862092-Prymnesium_polylepis.1